MIRRDFMKLLSIATAGIALLQTPFTKPAVANITHKSKRQWLSGSARSGCAHLPNADLLPQ
jgi:Ni,Fe-hydrogenase I small subunit